MTRENKVALVVGFALVLFVGILVSDHLSKAQTQRTADLLPAAGNHPAAVRRPARFVDLLTSDRPRPGPPTKAPLPQPVAPAEPPAARVYTVRPGESLSTICQRVYGTASLTPSLAAHNKITDPDKLWAGKRLALPPADVLAPGDGATATPTLDFRTYQVTHGDSLSTIAQRFMGSADRWQQLYDLNRNAIDNPDAIQVGTVLKVPTG